MSKIRVKVEKRRARRRRFGPLREWVVIAVEDKGIGMDKKEIRKIFRKYYRLPSARDLNVSGVGLGLALCRGIVKRHGGWIEVESEKGKGSSFRVYLPARTEGGNQSSVTSNRLSVIW